MLTLQIASQLFAAGTEHHLHYVPVRVAADDLPRQFQEVAGADQAEACDGCSGCWVDLDPAMSMRR
jgi:hypothetical protein